MNDVLILILSIIGLFALYWVLAGQWKYNRQMMLIEEKENKVLKNKIKAKKKIKDKIKN